VLARGHTIFHGRTQELALLKACWARVRRGAGQIVCLVGEAGIGKSRLAYEFQQTLGEARRLTAQSLSYGQAMPYHAIIPLLRTVPGVVEATASSEQHQAIHTRLGAIDSGLASDASLLAQLLGVPLETEPLPVLAPEAQRRRLQLACLQVLVQQAADTPLCLLVEDSHWLDPSSQEVLDLLVAALARRPIMVLCTARPGFRHAWADSTYFHQVAVEPLAAEETDALLRDLLRPYEAPAALKALIRERTGGNPLFVDELVRAMQAHGLLTVQGEVYKVAAEARAMLPVSIQGIVQARLDRLPPEEKRLLQTAAVLGTDVSLPLLQAIAETPEEILYNGLAHLQAAEFLYETRLFPEREYTFKHALIHEVAYGSLLQDWRRALHARTMEAMEALYADRLAEQVERLAHHALRGEVWDKALAYCRQAGEKAMARSAHREAVGCFEQALSALQHLPEQHDTIEQTIDLRLALRSALDPAVDFERTLAYLREAEAIAVALDDPHRLAEVSVALSRHFSFMGMYDQAIATVQRALTLATDSGDIVLHALVNQRLGVAYLHQGDYRRAIDCFRQSAESLDGARRRERFGSITVPAVMSRTWTAWCHAELGTFAEGTALGDEGLRIAEAVNHPASLLVALWGSGLLALRQGDLPRALVLLERAMGICQDAGLPTFFSRIAAALGSAYALAGRVAGAAALLPQTTEQTMATELVEFQALYRLSLGEAHMLAGRLEAAHDLAEGAMALTRRHQERGNQAYALRLLGEIAARREPPDVAQAEAHYQQALALAKELGMRPLLAHCHLGLGTLYAKIGRPEQARPELSAAIVLYRAMELTFWLPRAEAALAQVT
jgi:tetratricopeptide (TPR) repeat protein